MILIVCGGCHRHVLAGAASCPFCGARVPEHVVPEVYELPRMGRAAMVGLRGLGVAGAIAIVGCGAGAPVPDRATESVSVALPYGAPPLVEERYPHVIAFAPGSDELDEAALDALTDLLPNLEREDIRGLLLQGFADGAATSDPSGLGARRAAAVARALVGMGVPESAIQAVGVGQHPDTGEGRDEVVITLRVVGSW